MITPKFVGLSALLLVLCMLTRADAEEVNISLLGDLSVYKATSEEALKSLNNNDMKAVKLKLKDLETSWDANEATLKAKSDAAWGVVDKKIDRALALVRAAKPDVGKCGEALQALVDVFTPPTKK